MSTTSAIPDNPTSIPPSLLLLILDIHPLSWSLLAETPPPPKEDDPEIVGAALNKTHPTSLSINEFLNALIVFLNSHLAAAWGNDVVVYGATAGRSKLLYPLMDAPDERIAPNMFHPFTVLDNHLQAGLKGMVREEQERIRREGPEALNDQPAIVSALTKALCYINRVLPSNSNIAAEETVNHNPNKIEPRIMVINATPSSAPAQPSQTNGDASAPSMSVAGGGGEMRGGYVGMMNCVFAAQKAKVPIDVLTLPPLSGGTAPPIFLQQASHLTDGVYWRWNGRGGILQYLHSIYLPPPSLRQRPFAVPPQDAVDFRAVCFCHHNVVDVGFVCSVCLSIFCEPKTSCLMCKTKFPIKAIATLRALAANISPIPVPKTVVAPEPRKQHESSKKIRLTVNAAAA